MSQGQDNLIPTNKRSKDEARQISSNGGKKSGESRRRSKSIRQALQTALKGDYTVLEEKLQGYDALAVKMILTALDGNVQAFKEIRDSIGEKPGEKIEHDGVIEIIINGGKSDYGK